MPTFAYIARDMAGKQVNGTIEAAGEREVTAILADKSLFPVNVEQADGSNRSLFRSKKQKANGQTMALYYSQLASLLRAGVPMIRSLNVLSEQSSQPILKEVIGEIRSRVEDGEPLGDAMARYPGIFSEMACNMVRAGSEGGFLEDALERVGAFTELQEDLKGRTISALAYPVFLFSVGTVVLSALLVFFVPKFDMLFDRLRRADQMPVATEWLLSFSNFLQQYGWIVLFAVAVLFLSCSLPVTVGRRKGFR